jgi:hypothetical protein
MQGHWRSDQPFPCRESISRVQQTTTLFVINIAGSPRSQASVRKLALAALKMAINAAMRAR